MNPKKVWRKLFPQKWKQGDLVKFRNDYNGWDYGVVDGGGIPSEETPIRVAVFVSNGKRVVGNLAIITAPFVLQEWKPRKHWGYFYAGKSF